MRVFKILYFSSLGLSAAVGIWHFFIPYMYRWYSYIPEAPRALTVSVDWINYLFSLLLSGLSVILIFMYGQFFNKDKQVVIFYSFLTFIWFNRVLITLIHPWAYDRMMIMQVLCFTLIFIMMLIPLLSLSGKKKG